MGRREGVNNNQVDIMKTHKVPKIKQTKTNKKNQNRTYKKYIETGIKLLKNYSTLLFYF